MEIGGKENFLTSTVNRKNIELNEVFDVFLNREKLFSLCVQNNRINHLYSNAINVFSSTE